MAYNKFELNAIQKQDEAYKVSFAKKCFDYSCNLCCKNNLRGGKGSCDNCPIKEAHIRAMIEIQSGVRGKERKLNDIPTYGATKHNCNGRVTIVMNFY